MAEAKWELLVDFDVCSVIAAVARSTAQKNEGILEVDDLEQDGATLIATRPNLQDLAARREYRLLYNALSQELFKHSVRPLIRTGAMESMRYAPLDPIEDVMDARGVEVATTTSGGDYSGEMIETLLPGVWDESYTYGLPQKETAPDPDMPRASTNKATGNNIAAYLADIKSAWAGADIADEDRRVLILRYGLGWTQEQIAFNQETTQSTVSRRTVRGISALADFLNGVSA